MAKTETKTVDQAPVMDQEPEMVQETETVLKNTVAGTAPAVPERVEIYIPKDSGDDDPNLMVGINGVNYLLPKGETSLVPPEVAYEIKRSWRAQKMMDDNKNAMIEKAYREALNPVMK